MSIKITHLTSAHPRYDTRIFIKMCSSLAMKKEYEVSLIVADGLGNELKNGVQIVDIGAKEGGRIARMTQTSLKVFNKAVELNSAIYHIHDPELIPIGLKLKKLGYKVIFDAHEDLPKQILAKPYLNRFSRKTLSFFASSYEKFALRKFDGIVTATPYLRDKFLKINDKSIDVNNFPIVSELSNKMPWSQKADEICYIGNLTTVRGIKEIVQSMEFVEGVRLNIAGKYLEDGLEEQLHALKGWEKVNFLGFLDRQGVAELLKRSKAGVVTLYPIINYIDALPVKMFEYMIAQLPVISSDIELWQEIVEGNKCGICVDPKNPQAIAKAIKTIFAEGKKSQLMGENGKNAVIKKYNWRNEEEKLLFFYKKLLQRSLDTQSKIK